jgi:hypothetical protein
MPRKYLSFSKPIRRSIALLVLVAFMTSITVTPGYASATEDVYDYFAIKKDYRASSFTAGSAVTILSNMSKELKSRESLGQTLKAVQLAVNITYLANSAAQVLIRNI